MNKEEIKHFKAMLRQGSLRHMNILLDDKFQKELLNTIKDYENLQQENQQLKEIEKEHQRINGELRVENKELQDRIDNAVEIIEKEIECLKDKKRMIMQVLTPENGYLKADVEYEIKRLEKYLEILKGDKK